VSNERCAELSRASGEPLAATATTATHWLVVEVAGAWPRDVSADGALPEPALTAVTNWLARTPGSRLQFVRRPGRAGARPVTFVVRAEETIADLRAIELQSHDQLADVDLDSDGTAVESQLVLVCGHGARDACCAREGTAVFGALADAVPAEALWISSHQGGHRFAANVLVLPAGVQYGRVQPETAPSVVTRALAGTIESDFYRGRTCYAQDEQAAERAVREAASLYGIGDLRLSGKEGAIVRFRTPDGTEYAGLVEEVEGPTIPASCGAEPEPQRVFRARIV
jgi:hypothetical protein